MCFVFGCYVRVAANLVFKKLEFNLIENLFILNYIFSLPSVNKKHHCATIMSLPYIKALELESCIVSFQNSSGGHQKQNPKNA